MMYVYWVYWVCMELLISLNIYLSFSTCVSATCVYVATKCLLGRLFYCAI